MRYQSLKRFVQYSVASVSANLNSVPVLNGNNFKDWKENIFIVLRCMDLDLALRMDRPAPLTDTSTSEQMRIYEKWDRSNRMSLMIIKRGIPEAFRGAVSEEVTDATTFLAEIEKRFAKSDKAETMLISLPPQFSQFKGKKRKNEAAKDKGPAHKKQTQTNSDDGCFFCNMKGHMKKECAKYIAWRAKKGTFLTLVCSEGCLSYQKPNDAERSIYVGDGKSINVEAIGHFSLSINSNTVGTGSLMVYDNLYLLDTVASYNETLNVESRGTKRKMDYEKSSSLWHKRLGHISRNRVERLVSDGILDSINFSDFDVCIECIKGKQTKTKKLGAKRATDVLELIHTDIYGPFPTPSWNGQRYFAEVENQLSERIKQVRSDRGGEYYGRYDGSGEQRPGPFARYLEECGIVPQYTMPGSPSMNGVAERRNRTLKDMVRSMITEARPYRPNEKKLEPKTVSSYFIGYSERSRGFKFYDPKVKNIFETGTAKFFEDIEFGGRNTVKDFVFEEDLESTTPLEDELIPIPIVAFDNIQDSIPNIDQVLDQEQPNIVNQTPEGSSQISRS
ncbi:uncharacterized protein LOC133039825 [Cannabis sativa]|uniref:uncharacterized protein LOC133039825 n=1 Tax=Cannabis sativa TaxID=3483 RepID=UPI0029C9BE56|nr:uncharacterized protein LOC133039825 [Cannabis sativa]